MAYNIPLTKMEMVREHLLKRGVELPADVSETSNLIARLVTSLDLLIYMREHADAWEGWKDATSGREVSHQEAIKICHEITEAETKEGVGYEN